MYETVIIGGSPAGAAAAILLARAGRQVLLLERETAAHDKVCGEFISREACDDLARLGVDLLALGAVAIRSIRVSAGHLSASVPLPFSASSLSRRVLDEELLRLAGMAGADIRRGAQVGQLACEEGGWTIGGPDLPPIRARTVFLATGKHDLRGWQRPQWAGSEVIGFKMHFRPTTPPPAEVRLFLFNGGYAGIEPVENGLLNLSLAVSKQRFAASGKNWDSLLTSIGADVPAFHGAMTDAVPCWAKPLAVSRIPYGFLHRAKDDAPGLYRLGDQMAVTPSFTGDGMAIALRTAVLAAEALLAGDSAAGYTRRARADLRRQMRVAGLLAWANKVPVLRRGFVRAAARWPLLLRAGARYTRLRAR